jgi:hypothetical protein
MDSLNSKTHDASRDLLLNEPVDTTGTQGKSSAKVDDSYPASEKNLPDASTVIRLTSTSSASSDIVLQPGEWQEEDTNESDQTNIALASRHSFSEIPIELITVYQVLLDVEANATSKHKELRKALRAHTDVSDAIRYLKRQAHLGKSLEDTAEYQRLRGNRSGKSYLETQLPSASAFRALLYPPTGAVRDTRTGLYAELRKVTIDQKPVFVLCFPGTGAARNKDTQWKANLQQAFGAGGLPRLYTQALVLAKELKTVLAGQGFELHVAGHSMGGGVANFLGLALGIDSYCFNAAALGGACLNQLEIDGCLTAERIDRQNHVTLKGDYASNRTLSKAIGLLSPAGKKPQQVGNVYQATEEDEDFPQVIFPLDRHPLDAMQDMMYTQKTSLWRNTRQSAATTPSSSSSSSTPTKSPASPAPTQSDPSTSDELIDDSESG